VWTAEPVHVRCNMQRRSTVWTQYSELTRLFLATPNLMPLIRQLQVSGTRTVRALAAELNARGVRSARGGVWHPTTVHKLLTRAVSD